MRAIHFFPVAKRKLAILAAQQESAPVLIVGEPGTGKVSLAEWLHLNGARTGKSFYLAKPDRPLVDQMREAQNGTLVVDEFARLPQSDLMVLLELLTRKSVPCRQGPHIRMLLQVRMICCSSDVLPGCFWHDQAVVRRIIGSIFFRIDIPRLCHRQEDFEDIAYGLLREISQELGKEHLRRMSKETMAKFKMYDWPGNIRELRNIIKFAAAVAKGSQIEVEDLPDFQNNEELFQSNRETFERAYLIELLKIFEGDVDKTSERICMQKPDLLSKMRYYGIGVQGGQIIDTALPLLQPHAQVKLGLRHQELEFRR